MCVKICLVQFRGSRIEVTKWPSGWLVTGEIDASTSETLTQAFAEVPFRTGSRIELDLAGVSFIDSTGLGVLLRLAEQVAAVGGTVVIRNPARAVRRLLAITELESMFGLSGREPPQD